MKTIFTTEQPASFIIKQAVEVLLGGGLIIYPTETVYGVGVDATNPTAVNKLLAYKSRREGKPLSIVVSDRSMAKQFIKFNPQAEKLFERFLPGPVTIVAQGRHQTAPGVESEFGTLGIRIPDYPLIQQLVTKLGRPMTATSANASGKKRPYTVSDILDNLSATQKKKIDLVIDAGHLPSNPPSTVIDTTLSTPLTMRGGRKLTPNQSLEQVGLMLKSQSDRETQQIAGKLLFKYWHEVKKHGLVIGLDGQLGAGKTIFAKGIAQFLGIKETVTSPTYSYVNDYNYQRHQQSGQFYHLDVWKIDSQQELNLLALPKMIKPGNVLAIEWWQQIEPFVKKIKIKPLLIKIEVNPNQARILKVIHL